MNAYNGVFSYELFLTFQCYCNLHTLMVNSYLSMKRLVW